MPSPCKQKRSPITEDRNSFAIIYEAGQWRINSVSPMYNLQYNPIKLKQYAAKIKQVLATESTINSNFDVVFEQDNELRNSKLDPSAIIITISTETQHGSTKCSYAGILMSWGCVKKLPAATHLPFYLDRGDSRVSYYVKKTLSMMFDCNIKQYIFSQHNLLRFGFQFVQLLADSGKQIGFTYTRMGTVNNKITIGFDINDIYNILNCFQDIADKQQQIFEAYQMLQNQVYLVYQMDIVALDLVEINLANKVKIKANGLISMKTPEAVTSVLNILNETSDIKYL